MNVGGRVKSSEDRDIEGGERCGDGNGERNEGYQMVRV